MEISIALGGGGSKGNAHIGILRVLDREGIHIGAMAGSSIGGLIGAVYLAGYTPDQIEAHLTNVDQEKLFERVRGDGPGLLGLSHVGELLAPLLNDVTFEDLPIPFAVTSMNLNSGQEFILNSGRLLDAIMATIAVPGIFPPKEWGKEILVDGGVSNPVPVALVRSMAPHLPVVAVALTQPHKAQVQLPPIDYFGPSPVLRQISRFRVAQAFNIYLRSVDISGRLLTDLRLKAEKPDILIRPDVNNIAFLEQVDVSDVVSLGEIAAEAALGKIRKAASWPARLARRLRMIKVFSRTPKV